MGSVSGAGEAATGRLRSDSPVICSVFQVVAWIATTKAHRSMLQCADRVDEQSGTTTFRLPGQCAGAIFAAPANPPK